MLASLKMLLRSVVDYAGLFPPARLNLPEAMATYDRVHTTAYSWMLGRFVLPIAQLPEFTSCCAQFSLNHWSLSLILSDRAETELEQLSAFQHDSIAIKSLEFPVLSLQTIDRLLPHLPTGVEAFFELPWNNLEPYLAALQGTGAFAKIRTGGMTPTAFPTATQLGQFIQACAIAQIPFKATAGLHHPLPGNYRVTYEPDSATATMQGFLNLAIVAALMYHQKITLEAGTLLLKTSSLAQFQATEQGLSWHNYALTGSEMETARQQGFRSFGSCSFHEPVDELKTLKLL
jgi:hypothetical protein